MGDGTNSLQSLASTGGIVLKLQPDVFETLFGHCSEAIGRMRAVQENTLFISTNSSFDSIGFSTPIVEKYAERGRALEGVLGEHIDILNGLVDAFVAAEKAYLGAEAASIEGLGGMPTDAGGFTVPAAESGTISDLDSDFGLVSEHEGFEVEFESYGTGAVLDAEYCIPDVEVYQSFETGIYAQSVADKGSRWRGLATYLNDAFQPLREELATLETKWDGPGKEQAVKATQGYAKSAGELTASMRIIGNHMDYVAAWLAETSSAITRYSQWEEDDDGTRKYWIGKRSEYESRPEKPEYGGWWSEEYADYLYHCFERDPWNPSTYDRELEAYEEDYKKWNKNLLKERELLEEQWTPVTGVYKEGVTTSGAEIPKLPTPKSPFGESSDSYGGTGGPGTSGGAGPDVTSSGGLRPDRGWQAPDADNPTGQSPAGQVPSLGQSAASGLPSATNGSKEPGAESKSPRTMAAGAGPVKAAGAGSGGGAGSSPGSAPALDKFAKMFPRADVAGVGTALGRAGAASASAMPGSPGPAGAAGAGRGDNDRQHKRNEALDSKAHLDELIGKQLVARPVTE
ncbi:hypothetical protein ACFVMC_01960 [Nocardia sp. NPDC127579]|uniref:hypothetical protein n=1 Tax=Nocardia sp. NPDC127579 TaxID=3345402 RepID=UPI0036440459